MIRPTSSSSWKNDRLLRLSPAWNGINRLRLRAGSILASRTLRGRLISDVDWNELFERISPVDDVLSAASLFRDMDFPTRNLYRSAIEELAPSPIVRLMWIARCVHRSHSSYVLSLEPVILTHVTKAQFNACDKCTSSYG